MTGGGEGRPHLEVVRDPEDLPEDVKVIEAYCDELLWDKEGHVRKTAVHEWTPFRHATREWSRVVFFREGKGYTLSFYAEPKEHDALFGEPNDATVFEVSMQPFDTVFPGRRAPEGSQWFIQAGKPVDMAPQEQSYDPAYFRVWLEEIWGPLPRDVQKSLGIIQGRQSDEPPKPDGA